MRLGPVHVFAHHLVRMKLKLTDEWLGAPCSSRLEEFTKEVCQVVPVE
jgi:hypothetical protein